MIKFSTYHKILRICSAVLACVLLFQAGLVSQTTATLATHTQLYLASAVAVTTSTSAISEVSFEQLEESSVFNDVSNEVQDRSTFILSATLLIILLLIVLNYSLEYIRANTPTVSKIY